jgi:hypothetical protein
MVQVVSSATVVGKLAKSWRKVCRFGAEKYPSMYEFCSEAEETKIGIKTFARTAFKNIR